MEKFSLADLFADFQSGHIGTKELEGMLRDVVRKEHPEESIKKFKYMEDGVIIILDSGDTIEVQIDWNELILE